MPQPIAKIIPDPHVVLSRDVLDDKPDMAALVCKIFATWATVEQYLSILLVSVLAAHADPALAMFSTLTAQHLQLGALDAAAKATLSADDYNVFKSALAVADSAQTPRNHLPHWTWGRCRQREDLLLLADPDMHSTRDLRLAKLVQAPGKADHKEVAKQAYFDLDGILAYSKSDLERSLRDLEEARNAIQWMSVYLDPSFIVHLSPSVIGKTATPPPIRAAMLDRLNGLRLFREALARIRGDQQNTPSPPRESPPKEQNS